MWAPITRIGQWFGFIAPTDIPIEPNNFTAEIVFECNPTVVYGQEFPISTFSFTISPGSHKGSLELLAINTLADTEDSRSLLRCLINPNKGTMLFQKRIENPKVGAWELSKEKGKLFNLESKVGTALTKTPYMIILSKPILSIK